MRTPKVPEMPRVAAFLGRSGKVFDSMKARFRERKYKTGRLAGHVFRAARQLPFTREEFQDWLSKKLGGPDGAVKCRYCTRFLTALDVSVDHVDPVSQGGSLGLENLDICCDECNRLKGGLTLATFMKLREMMVKAGIPGEMTVADRKNLESRLKSGGMQYRGKPADKVNGQPKLVESSKSLFTQQVNDDKW